MDILRKKYKQGEDDQKAYREKAENSLVRNDDFIRLNRFLKSSSESDFEVKFNAQKSKTYENFCSLDLFNDDERDVKINAAESISVSNNDDYLVNQMLRLSIKDEDPSIDEKRLKITEIENGENKNINARNIKNRMTTNCNNLKEKRLSEMNRDAMVRKDDYARLNDFLKSSSESDIEEKFNEQKTEIYENFCSSDLLNDDRTDVKGNASENIGASNNDEYLVKQRLDLEIKDEDLNMDEKIFKINEKENDENENINARNIKSKIKIGRDNNNLSQINKEAMVRNDDSTRINDSLKSSSESDIEEKYIMQKIEANENFRSSDLLNDDGTDVKENAAENINASKNNKYSIRQRFNLEMKNEHLYIDEQKLEINEENNSQNENINVCNIKGKTKTEHSNFKQKYLSEMNTGAMIRKDDYTRLNDFLESSSESDIEEKVNELKIETYENFCSSDLLNDDGTYVKENASENISASKNDEYLVKQRIDFEIKDEHSNIDDKRLKINENTNDENKNVNDRSIKRKISSQTNWHAMGRNDDYTTINLSLKSSSESDTEEKYIMQKIEANENFRRIDLLNDDGTNVKENVAENINASNKDEYLVKQKLDLEIKDEDLNIDDKGLEINEKVSAKNSNINTLNVKSEAKTGQDKINHEKKSSLKQSNSPVNDFNIRSQISSQYRNNKSRQKRKKGHYSESCDQLESPEKYPTKYFIGKLGRRNRNDRNVIENDELYQNSSQRSETSSFSNSIHVPYMSYASDQNNQHDIRKIYLNRKTLDKQKNKHSYKTDNEQFSSDISFEQTPKKPYFPNSILGRVRQSPSISLTQTDDELEPGEIPLFRKNCQKLLDQCEQPYSVSSLSVFNSNSEYFEEGEIDIITLSSVNDLNPKRSGKICSWWKRQKQAFVNIFKACVCTNQ